LIDRDMIKILSLIYLYTFLSLLNANASVDMIIVEKSMRILKLLKNLCVL